MDQLSPLSDNSFLPTYEKITLIAPPCRTFNLSSYFSLRNHMEKIASHELSKPKGKPYVLSLDTPALLKSRPTPLRTPLAAGTETQRAHSKPLSRCSPRMVEAPLLSIISARESNAGIECQKLLSGFSGTFKNSENLVGYMDCLGRTVMNLSECYCENMGKYLRGVKKTKQTFEKMAAELKSGYDFALSIELFWCDESRK